MAEEHAISGRQHQRVAGAFFPSQVLRPFEKLTVLDAAELCERAIGGLITPNALARRKHRIAAVALFIVAVILIAVNDDLVADLPAFDLRADGPNDARGIGSGDMVRAACGR